MNRPLFVALEIVRTLREAGCEAYLVGGCVRDRVLGRVPKDYDVATDALPDRIAALLPGTVFVGAKFGVSLWRETEIATFRSEGIYSDHRRPDNVSFGTMQEDAGRRDFTMNALYELPDLARPEVLGAITDFHAGLDDIRRRTVRAVGAPRRRFQEDSLRLMRCVRFAAELGFGIEADTFEALCECAPLLRHISRERVSEELCRMLLGGEPVAAVSLLDESGLLAEVLPSAVLPNAQLACERLRMWSENSCEKSLAATLALLTTDVYPQEEADIVQVLRDLRLSNETVRDTVAMLSGMWQLCGLTGAADVASARVRRLMAHPLFEQICVAASVRATVVGDDPSDILAAAELCASLRRSGVALAPDPLLTGQDLQSRGMSPGPVFGRVLDAVYDAQLEGRVTSRDEAWTLAECLSESE